MHIAASQEWTLSHCDSPLQVLHEEGSEAQHEGTPPPKRVKHSEKVIEQHWKADLEKEHSALSGTGRG